MDDEEFTQVLERMQTKRMMTLVGHHPGQSSKKRFMVKGLFDSHV